MNGEPPSEHRYVPLLWLVWLPFAAIFMTLFAHKAAAAWSWPQYAVYVAPLIAAVLLLLVLFYRRIRVTDAGVESRGLLGGRALAWGAVRSVDFKGGGHHNGHRQSDKVILRGDAGKVVASSSFSDYELLRSRIEAALLRAGGPSLAAAVEAHGRTLRAWIFAPHIEELVEMLSTILLLGGAVYTSLLLLQTTPLLAGP